VNEGTSNEARIIDAAAICEEAPWVINGTVRVLKHCVEGVQNMELTIVNDMRDKLTIVYRGSHRSPQFMESILGFRGKSPFCVIDPTPKIS
jgi:hypothetical protein